MKRDEEASGNQLKPMEGELVASKGKTVDGTATTGIKMIGLQRTIHKEFYRKKDTLEE